MFSRYVGFELKRLVKTPKNIVVIFLFILSILIYFAYNLYMYESANKNRVDDLTSEINVSTAEIIFYRSTNESPTGMVIYELLNNYHFQLGQIHVNARLMSLGSEHAYRWSSELDAIIRRDEAVLEALYKWRIAYNEEMSADGVIDEDASKMDFTDTNLPLRFRSLTESGLIASIQKFRYLQNIETPPVLSEFNMSGWQFLLRLITVLGRFAIPVLVVFFSADAFSAERDMGSYKFLLLQPLSRTQVYFAKITASLIFSAGVIFIFTFLFSGINALINGIGSAYYPIRFSLFNTDSTALYIDGPINAYINSLDPGTSIPPGFAPVSEFLLFAALFIMIYCLFIISFTAIISIFAEDSIYALAVSLGIVFLSLLVSVFVPRRGFAWNPLEYSDITALTSETLNGPVWYPALWFFVLTILGVVYFNRKDIVC